MTAGDVYTYTPKNTHCTEGLAIENERGQLVDWYWSGDIVWDQIVGKDAEDLEKIANLNDYELTRHGGRESNKDYASEDRLTITAQHGHQRTYYTRKGATPDLTTKIENAEDVLWHAHDQLRTAQRAVERAQEALDKLLSEAEGLDES